MNRINIQHMIFRKILMVCVSIIEEKNLILFILGRSSNPQQDFLLNNNTNRTSRLTLYGKTNTKITIIKCLMLLIIFLTYTIILIVLTYYLFLKLSPLKKPVPIDNQLVHNRGKTTTNKMNILVIF